MRNLLSFHENNIHMVFEITLEDKLCLLHFSSMDFDDASIDEKEISHFDAVELHATGGNQNDHHGAKHTGGSESENLKYRSHQDYKNGFGRKLEFTLNTETLSVVLHYQFYNLTTVVRCWTVVTNFAENSVGLEYVSSFALMGVDKEGQSAATEKMRVMLPHNAWCEEISWKTYRLADLGLNRINCFSTKRISVQNSGTWSAKEYLPMGCVLNTETGGGLLWQIENNGSWQWEISDLADRLYLKLSGPTENENHWWKKLKPGESFQTVPVAVAVSADGFDGALGEMTKYRRKIVRKNEADSFLPVIFNDYMNCLNAEPTTEKLIPVIDAAAKAGAEYFCIDAGWYADGTWWDTVGQWQPCGWRFPNGIKAVLDYIREKGMVPGMWLELEVIGINSPNAADFDDTCYFMRHGEKVIDHGRYQLDFRNEKVTAFATAVIDRLVSDYGVGYIKMDYNIDGGIGTEVNADSFGDGLLEHNRAYLKWLEGVMDKYPRLIIENCGSGGMRMDYAMLGLHPIQSVTDQTDYIKMAPIAAAAATAVLPEQAAIWSYPLADATDDAVVFNMVNAMLCRIHLSGQIMTLNGKKLALVREGVRIYKEIRREIGGFIPFYPLGMPDFDSGFVCVGYLAENTAYLAFWRLGGNNEQEISLPFTVKAAKWLYPEMKDYTLTFDADKLTVKLPREKTAGIIQVEL